MDIKSVIHQMALFLGKPIDEETVAKISDHCSFVSMKANPNTNYDWMYKDGRWSTDRPVAFMRKGRVGDWKNHFSEELSSLFDRRSKEILERDGLVHTYELPC